MSKTLDLDNPDVQNFLELLAKILAENFMEEQRGELLQQREPTQK